MKFQLIYISGRKFKAIPTRWEIWAIKAFNPRWCLSFLPRWWPIKERRGWWCWWQCTYTILLPHIQKWKIKDKFAPYISAIHYTIIDVLETPLHLPPWNAYASSPDLWVGDQLSQMVPTWSMECEEFHLDFVDPGIFPLSFLSTSFWRCLDTFLSYIRWQQGKCTAACFV